MSTTRKSSSPSRLMSAKSIPIENMLLFLSANAGASRNRPCPTLSQRRSTPSKSLQTYRSGRPSRFMSRNITARPHSYKSSGSGEPFALMNRPLPASLRSNRNWPRLRYSTSGRPFSSIPPRSLSLKRFLNFGPSAGTPSTLEITFRPSTVRNLK